MILTSAKLELTWARCWFNNRATLLRLLSFNEKHILSKDCSQVSQNAEYNPVIFWHLFTFTSNPWLQYKLTYLAKSSGSNTFAQCPLPKRTVYKESCECVQLLGFWIDNNLYDKTFRTDYLCAISMFLVITNNPRQDGGYPSLCRLFGPFKNGCRLVRLV